MIFFSSFRDNKPLRVVFFGDSITQAGVSPDGYITMMQNMLKEKGKDKNYELFGAGVGGNKIYDCTYDTKKTFWQKSLMWLLFGSV